MSKKVVIGVVVALLAIVSAFVVFFPKRSNAIIPFGGNILMVTPCSCTAGYLIKVGPPVPGVFIYQPGVSILYPLFQIYRPGPWVLGFALPGGVCKIYVGKGCAILPAEGTIAEVGTSI